MAEPRDVQHFFGFCKFFPFGKGKRKTLSSSIQENDERDTYCSIPTKMEITQDEFSEYFAMTWANIFFLHKGNGKVKVCGWGKSGNISPKEDIFLPLDDKVVNLKASWDKLLLTTDQGRCHVLWNVYDDWTVHPVTSDGTDVEEKTFLFGGLGDSHCIVVDNDGKLYEIKENKIPSTVTKFLYCPIPLAIQVDQVSCGKEHVLLLNNKQGTVYSFGLGSRGQLGLGQVNPEKTPKLLEALAGIRIKQIASGGWHSIALSEFGDVYAWGWNDCGQLGITCVPPEVPLMVHMLPYIVEFPVEECVVTCVGCGSRHSVAVTSEPDENVWTWGWGYYGQLGHGDTENRKTPTLVEHFRNVDSQVVDISCGPWQTVVHTKTKNQKVD